MATLDEAIDQFSRRHGWTLEKGRTEAKRLIENAVEQALAGSQTSFDTLPHELEDAARQIFQERLRRGEGAEGVEFFSGTTGARL
jgi:vacuolar-type H+-ATPase subunit H